MKTLLQHIGITSLVCATALGGALAQTATPDIDLNAIRARAASNAGEAEALAASARERAKALTGDASTSAEAGKANGHRYAGSGPPPAGRPADLDMAFDFDRMVADAGDMAKEGMGEAPRFIAFASLSMPPAALRAMIEDVPRAGGVVVFRGLTQGSAKAMTQALGQVLGQAAGESGQMNGAGIDPRLFRAFGIEAVPAYVVTANDFDLCSGFDCVSDIPPFDRMTGNVTAEYALQSFAGGGGPGARIAAQHLARLERNRQ